MKEGNPQHAGRPVRRRLRRLAVAASASALVLASLALVAFHPVAALGLLGAQDAASLARASAITFGVAALSVLCALLVTMPLRSAIDRPISRLIDTTARVARDRDFSLRAARRAEDPLGALVDGFNAVLAQIDDRERELQAAHLDLERRVEERTRELQDEIAARKRIEETIRQMAYFDALTGLPNRVLFNDRLSQALTYAERNNEMVAVMLLDLDRFKTINDTLGHAMGDKVLKAVAQRLRASLRAEDTVARVGGDEFPILLPGVRQVDDAVKVAEKIVETLRPPLDLDGHRLYATASVGLALFPVHGADGAALIKNADSALYRAKDRGRDNCEVYTAGSGDRALERLVLENSLRRALEVNELAVHYQPIVEARSGAIVTVEALLRWQHPELGLLLPSAFVGLAEETGLILPLGEWVLRTACGQVHAWQSAGLSARLAVDLSARHFRQKDLAERIERLLAESGLEPHSLTLEVREAVVLESAEQGVLALLESLRALGVHLAIDAFGTGYSSLAHLKRLPADALKIDPTFIQDVPADPGNSAIATLIVTMAHSLGLKVVAEGVETQAQLEFLAQAGCDFVQGDLFSRPVAAQGMTALLREGRLDRRGSSHSR